MITELFRANRPCYTGMYFSMSLEGHDVSIRTHDTKAGTLSMLYLAPYQGCDGTTYTLSQQLRDFFDHFKPVKIGRLEFLIATGLRY